MTTDAVILAAGKGRRMGGGGKALLKAGDATFLERTVALCLDGDCRHVWVVARPGDEAVSTLCSTLGVERVENPHPEDGMFSSIRIGLRAALSVSDRAQGVIVLPVDHPHVQASTVKMLTDSLRDTPDGTWVQPKYEGKSGHPVLLDRKVTRSVVEAPAESNLKEVIQSGRFTRIIVPVDDPGILTNVNTPEDLGRSDRAQ